MLGRRSAVQHLSLSAELLELVVSYSYDFRRVWERSDSGALACLIFELRKGCTLEPALNFLNGADDQLVAWLGL